MVRGRIYLNRLETWGQTRNARTARAGDRCRGLWESACVWYREKEGEGGRTGGRTGGREVEGVKEINKKAREEREEMWKKEK